MEHWKCLTDLYKLPIVESVVCQSKITVDNNLFVYLFSGNGIVDYQVTINFGKVLLYEVFQEPLLNPMFLHERSGINLGWDILFEIFNSEILNELIQNNLNMYHHYFISESEYYIECITTGIVSVDVAIVD